jgi:septum formation protein
MPREARLNPLLDPGQQQGLVLASSSPRRAAILSMLGFEFEVHAVAVAEDELGHPEPVQHVEQLARLKAEAAAATRPHGLFLGADTVVVVDGDILNKPSSGAEALAMQHRLRDRWHTVYTGVALLDRESGRIAVTSESTEVRFHAWDDAFLGRYVATGECDDKAGAYAIQGLGALLVREIRGCYYNVMGLPVGSFVRLLQQLRPPAAPPQHPGASGAR